MSDSRLRCLARAVGGDLSGITDKQYSYLYWNLHNVRVDRSSHVSTRASIEQHCLFVDHARVDRRATIGAWTYGTRCVVGNASIGRLVSIAPLAVLGLNSHPLNGPSTHPSAYDRHSHDMVLAPAVVGHDVWIGAGAVILQGVTVGSGAVIGANAVVTRDVAEYEIVAGSPARSLSFRTPRPDFIDDISNCSTDKIGSILRRYRGTK